MILNLFVEQREEARPFFEEKSAAAESRSKKQGTGSSQESSQQTQERPTGKNKCCLHITIKSEDADPSYLVLTVL
jgi:hypothetical protein